MHFQFSAIDGQSFFPRGKEMCQAYRCHRNLALVHWSIVPKTVPLERPVVIFFRNNRSLETHIYMCVLQIKLDIFHTCIKLYISIWECLRVISMKSPFQRNTAILQWFYMKGCNILWFTPRPTAGCHLSFALAWHWSTDALELSTKLYPFCDLSEHLPRSVT